MMMQRITNFARPAISVLLVVALSAVSVAPVMAAAVDDCEEPVMACEMSSPCCCPTEATSPAGGKTFSAPTCECEVSESDTPAGPPLRASLQRADAAGDQMVEVRTPGSTSVPPVPADRSVREGLPDYSSPPLFLTSCTFLI